MGQEETTKYQYNTLNQLTKTEQNDIITTYQYDENGNMTKEITNQGTTNYQYDEYNRLKTITKPDGQYQTNYYTIGNLRIAIEENGKYTRFTYQAGRTKNEQNSYGEIKKTNIIGYGQIATKQNGQTNYYLQNAHGDITNITNQEGQTINTYNYDAYGRITKKEENIPNRITYAGEQYDPIIEQYYLRARNYDPEIGRFIQEDSYRGDGLNLYTYVQNNPINYIDPSGYCSEKGNKLLTEDEFYDLTKKIIDSAEGRPYTYTPEDWETEFSNNIEPMIDMIPTDLDDSQRQPLVDAIIISEAHKLQAKYRAVNSYSDNVISKYITERGFYQSLEPLFTQYPTKDKPTNGLLKAFLEGVSAGFKAGIIQGAMDWGATYNKGTATTKVPTTTQGTTKTVVKTSADFMDDIVVKNGKYYAPKDVIDEIGQIEAKGIDFSQLNSKVMQSRASTEGGISQVIRYSDDNGTRFLIHEVTDELGNVLHRDFDAVRINSGQLINKLMK